jgi:hypothetical protein
LPSNAGGSLKPRLLRLQKRILLTWSVAGFLWRTTMNLQNGYRIPPHPDGSTAADFSGSESFLLAAAMKIFEPGLSSLLSPGT